MSIEPANCEKCGSELTLLDASPTSGTWLRSLADLAGFEASLVMLLFASAAICVGLGVAFDVIWYLLAAALVGVALYQAFSRPVEAVLTYKCTQCGVISSVEGSIDTGESKT